MGVLCYSSALIREIGVGAMESAFLTRMSILSGQVKLLAHECVPHYYSLIAEGTSQILFLYAGDDFAR
jgi:hypothetical protein